MQSNLRRSESLRNIPIKGIYLCSNYWRRVWREHWGKIIMGAIAFVALMAFNVIHLNGQVRQVCRVTDAVIEAGR